MRRPARLRGPAAVAVAAMAAGVLLSACVGPARSFGSYEGKAEATAKDMGSAVAAARLAVATAAQAKAFAPYVSVALADAEDDATSVQGAFDSIQPPDAASDRLRTELDGLLGRALDVLSDLRIAVRRGELDRLPRLAASLTSVAGRLEAFAKAHACPGRRC